jgi:hypothetical protein
MYINNGVLEIKYIQDGAKIKWIHLSTHTHTHTHTNVWISLFFFFHATYQFYSKDKRSKPNIQRMNE